MSARKTVLAAAVFLALLAVHMLDTRRIARQQDLQERRERLFDYKIENIEKVVLNNENGEFVLERRGPRGSWWLAEPIETRADADNVDPMLRNLQGIKKRNAFTPDFGLAQYDLDDPKVWVTLAGVEMGERKTVTILFGGPAAQTYQAYAKLQGEDEVFTLSDYAKRQCEKTLFQLRDKTVLPGAPEWVTGVEIVIAARSGSPSRAVSLHRSASGPDAWTFAGPDGAAADLEAVDNLLRTLFNARATRILDDPTSSPAALGLTPDLAQAKVTVYSGEESGVRADAGTGGTGGSPVIQSGASGSGVPPGTRTLYFGKPTREDADELYARVEGDSRVLVVRRALLADLDKEPKALRDRRLFNLAADSAAAIVIRSDDESVEVRRAAPGADWTFGQSTTPVESEGAAQTHGSESLTKPPVSQAKAAALLADLEALRAQEFVAEADDASADDLETWGFTPPALQVRLHPFDRATTVGFDRGEVDVDRGIVYIRRLEDGAILALDFKRVGQFQKFREDLDDRTFLSFDPDAVERVRIELSAARGPVTYEFTRRTSSWSTKAADGRRVTVQPYDVTSFLDTLAGLEYADTFTPPADDATRVGLNKPSVLVTLLGKAGADAKSRKAGERGSAAGRETGSEDGDEVLARLAIGERRGFRQIMESDRGVFVVDLTNTDQLTQSLKTLLMRVEQSPEENLLGGGPAAL